MWKLTPPDMGNPEAELVRALTRANGETDFETNGEQRAALVQLYEHYDATRGRPSADLLGMELGVPFLAAIYAAYDQVQKDRRLAHLRDRLMAGVLACPYCGFGEVTDLDHHLARSIYRAFSIYCKNLIPCCHRCNNKKRQAGGFTPEEQFAQPYLDEYSDDRFLVAQATVSPENGLRVEFSVVQCGDMANDVHERLAFQFSKLELNQRYEAQVVLFVTSQRVAIELAAENGPEALRNWLTRMHDAHVRSYGLNDWRTALIDSLVRSQEFCDGGFRYSFGSRGADL